MPKQDSSGSRRVLASLVSLGEHRSAEKRNLLLKVAHKATGRSSGRHGDHILDGASRREIQHGKVSVSWEATDS